MSSSATLSGAPVKGVLLKVTKLEAGGSITGRVGTKGMTWEDRGSNDGAVSEDAPESGEVSIGWVVYNTFQRPVEDLELMIRVMSRYHKLVGKEIMGELKVELKNTNQKEVQVMGATVLITIGSPQILVDETPAPRRHPCGTNHYGMLPEGISELSPADLDGCILWGEAHEPMTTWVAAHFLYHNKDFQTGEKLVRSPVPPIPKVKDHKGDDVNASASGAKSGFGVSQAPDKIISNAVPMLEIKPRDGETNPRVIQDGVIINFLTIPLFYPQKMTKEVLRWERKIGYELIPAMWREYDGVDYCTAFARTCPNYPATFTSRLSPLMRKPVAAMNRLMNREMRVIKEYIGQEYVPNPDVTRKDIYTEFKTEMGQQMGKQDFMGGEKPNATDVSFYGINILRFVTDVGQTRLLIEGSGLLPWMYRMMDILPPAQCLKMEFFGPSMEGWKGGWLMDPPQYDPFKLGGTAAPPPPPQPTAAAAKDGETDDQL